MMYLQDCLAMFSAIAPKEPKRGSQVHVPAAASSMWLALGSYPSLAPIPPDMELPRTLSGRSNYQAEPRDQAIWGQKADTPIYCASGGF